MQLIVLFIGSLVPFLFTFSSCFSVSAIASVLFGSFESAYFYLATPIVVNLLGLDSLTYGFGILMLTRGIAFLMGPPLGGLLIDKTGIIYVASFSSNQTKLTLIYF